MSERSNKIQWSGIIIGALLIFISIVAFRYPLGNFLSITWLIGLLIIINGILEIVYRRIEKRVLGISSGWVIALGVLNIIFGFVVMLNLFVSSIAFVYLFAFWFILSAFISLFTVTPAEHSNRGFRVISIILNIIFILAGVILLFNPLLGAITVSFIVASAFLISGVFYVLDAFG